MAVDDKAGQPRLTLILRGKAAIDSSLEDSFRKDEVLIREALRRRWGREPEDEEVLDILAISWESRLQRTPSAPPGKEDRPKTRG
jgi:hypothetical protein